MLIYLKGWRLTPVMLAKIESDKGGTLVFAKIQRIAIESTQVSHVQDATKNLQLTGDTDEKTLTEIHMANGEAVVVQGDMETVCEQIDGCAVEKPQAVKPHAEKPHAVKPPATPKKDTHAKLMGGTETGKRDY